jgi:hypothetical protein
MDCHNTHHQEADIGHRSSPFIDITIQAEPNR